MKIIHAAVQHLNPTALGIALPENLTLCQQAELLSLADDMIVRQTANSATRLLSAAPESIVHLAAAHSAKLLDYLSVRALLLGGPDSDFPDLSIF